MKTLVGTMGQLLEMGDNAELRVRLSRSDTGEIDGILLERVDKKRTGRTSQLRHKIPLEKIQRNPGAADAELWDHLETMRAQAESE